MHLLHLGNVADAARPAFGGVRMAYAGDGHYRLLIASSDECGRGLPVDVSSLLRHLRVSLGADVDASPTRRRRDYEDDSTGRAARRRRDVEAILRRKPRA